MTTDAPFGRAANEPGDDGASKGWRNARGEAALGRALRDEEVLVIGDTPHDVPFGMSRGASFSGRIKEGPFLGVPWRRPLTRKIHTLMQKLNRRPKQPKR